MRLLERTRSNHAFNVTEQPPFIVKWEESEEVEAMYHLLWWIDHTGTLYEVRNKVTTLIVLRHFVPV